MTIQVNGKQIDLPQSVNHISDLLNHYNLQSNQVIVELNQAIVDQKLHADTQIQNGDQVELVHFVGGG
ncbi:sulfur carrier protein ThiS [Pontibacillus marinus]|uniref:Sulfur carrier protein ThiS n=1 Tax=Pontibacillus marinus BH030004 = DSM 16465 TaxID=1385511 RepID=A0A0A5HSF3_9BACI|nr:sulfur carrier protein ThiS [Pontibacillus marinus]KGX86527.1 sulfur carrier protein ThiS [Pontibacillus marinus BH030004 = DSM 16465]